MALFDFLKKKKVPQNGSPKSGAANSNEQNTANVAMWESADAIYISNQHISDPGMHITCDVRYIPSNRVAICRTTSTNDATPRYETLVVPVEISNADGLVAFIMSQRPWLVHGYRLNNELRNRINETFNEVSSCLHIKENKQIQCPSDKHNFIQADVYTGVTKYKCEKCGLEIHAPILSGAIFKEYFGSYIDGIAHKWNPVDMRAEDIMSFAISFGDLPIVTVRYDGSVMKVKNSINGSRDGWMSFPKGYFDEKIIKVSEEDKHKLNACLSSLDFSSFTTSCELFRSFGAPGFCIRNRFLCYFSNGRGFECLSPRCDGFDAFVAVVKSVIGMQSEPIRSDALYDGQETGWFCGKCGSFNKLKCKFCGKCGMKRSW